MGFPKKFSVQRVHHGAGLPSIRVIPEDVCAEILNIDAAREIEIDHLRVIPEPVRGYNCIGKSKQASNRQYDAIAKVLLNS